MDYRRYNIVNNSLGWLCFVIAAVTYILTLEPTASFWDCPEFISQGYKLEVGHPPGNPIFMLTARFFINIFGSTPETVAWAVNLMSALLSAATILLLFWTITHLVRRLMVGRSRTDLTLSQSIVVMASGLCGALMYTWSDTFWFSAVEGEVYAFSSFCTALVFWLILKWDNRAEQPRSDRYLILIAYVIGISIAVHLLNLLTIPALGLVVYYRRSQHPTLRGSLGALLLSFGLVAVILYGIVPGFIEIAGRFEIFCVNTLHMPYNVGVLIYAVMLVGVLIWALVALYRQTSIVQIKISVILSVVLSGIPFIGSSWVMPVLILGALIYLLWDSRRLSVRLLTLTVMSILVIFVGYSSYALLLIRSSANPPMNQNSPDNVFALASYLNREQYGETPLFYGPTFASVAMGKVNKDMEIETLTEESDGGYERVVKESADDRDEYVKLPPKIRYKLTPNTIFPRMYSNAPGHPEAYLKWIGETRQSLPTVDIQPYVDDDGEPYEIDYGYRHVKYVESIKSPSFAQNLRYFFTYQLNHMYWRYFMWNFAGRQNDYQGNGELTRGNWISGIPFIDNARLGDQSLLPSELGEGNKGHNVFYMLPLLMGLIGIAMQMVRGRAGIEQFWVIFMLFFMTGIAIVFYLNQYPNQPRERDYAFAGSFYAYAIWVGMGVGGLWYALRGALGKRRRHDRKVMTGAAVVAAVVGLIVPLQVVSQTWDDHDRSGRYTTRDFGMNYLTSVDENGIIFTNGDNDTFPLWYAQEVEGYRTDVRVVNLAYLATDWYANQLRVPSYDAAGVPMLATPADYAYNSMQISAVRPDTAVTVPVNVFRSLSQLYKSAPGTQGYKTMRYPDMYIPVSVDDAVNAGVISATDSLNATDYINVTLASRDRGVTLSEILSLDIIASGAQNGWKRPTYFAMTVPDEYYLGLEPYMRNTGLAYQVTPLESDISARYELPVSTDKMYDNVMNKFRWGGLDQVGDNDDIYLDETIRRMVTTHRSAMLDLATSLYEEGYTYRENTTNDYLSEAERAEYARKADERIMMARNVLEKMTEKLPARLSPYSLQLGEQVGSLYCIIGEALDDKSMIDKGLSILESEILRYAEYVPYYKSLIAKESAARSSKYQQARVSILDLNLSTTDLYVPEYLYRLILSYQDSGGDLNRLGAKLDRMNVNIDDLTLLLDY